MKAIVCSENVKVIVKVNYLTCQTFFASDKQFFIIVYINVEINEI